MNRQAESDKRGTLRKPTRERNPIILYDTSETVPHNGRKPPWLRVRLPAGENHTTLKRLMRRKALHTVCEEAMCPNLAECWGRGTATFLILGNVCTRSCGFCAVKTGRPGAVDRDEPARVAEAVVAMNLHHAVITSVNRDDLPDGGAAIFAETIRQIRARQPECTVEVLIPDFKGHRQALATVMAARPEILNHNVETVPRLYRQVRPQAKYARSLQVIRTAGELNPEVLTKSGIMVGLGETWDELLAVIADLREVGCDILTVGQYLRPTRTHLPVVRYYTPAEFEALKKASYAAGFRRVESGPLVRSSYHAEAQARELPV